MVMAGGAVPDPGAYGLWLVEPKYMIAAFDGPLRLLRHKASTRAGDAVRGGSEKERPGP
jgi:hypothetical protein